MKWFRFYHDAADDPKVQRLPGDHFKFWVNLMCMASRSSDRGVITEDLATIAFATRHTEEEAERMIADLVGRTLLDEVGGGLKPHNWDKWQFKSDNVTERVQKHRRNDAPDDGNVTTNVSETFRPSPLTTDSDTDTDNRDGNVTCNVSSKPKRATQVPDDFAISEALAKWGADNGFTVAQMTAQVPEFIDHFRAKGEARKDWPASFHNWMRRAKKWNQLDQAPGTLRVVDGGGYDPLRTMPADEHAAYLQQLERAKREAERLERERRAS